jgi:hypothetical protein
MPFIHNEAAATRSGFGLSIVAAALGLVVVMVAIFAHAGPATDAMWVVGP